MKKTTAISAVVALACAALAPLSASAMSYGSMYGGYNSSYSNYYQQPYMMPQYNTYQNSGNAPYQAGPPYEGTPYGYGQTGYTYNVYNQGYNQGYNQPYGYNTYQPTMSYGYSPYSYSAPSYSYGGPVIYVNNGYY